MAPVDDGIAETEVNFRLPRGSDPGLDRVPKDIPIITGAVGAEVFTSDLGQTETPRPGHWCLDTAVHRPGRIRNADPDVSGTEQAAAGYRDTADDRPVCIRNADPDVSGNGKAAARYRDTAGDRPVRI